MTHKIFSASTFNNSTFIAMEDLFDSIPLNNPETQTHQHSIMLAMALLWMPHTAANIYEVLRLLQLKHGSGRLVKLEEIKQCIKKLEKENKLTSSSSPQGHYRLAPALLNPLYQELLDTIDPDIVHNALYGAIKFNPNNSYYYWPIFNHNDTVAIIRHMLITARSAEQFKKFKYLIAETYDWESILSEAILFDFDPKIFSRLIPDLRWEIAFEAVANFNNNWNTLLLPAVNWAVEQTRQNDLPYIVRLVLAEHLLHKGEQDVALNLLDGLTGGAADILRAYALAQQSKWPEAQTLFEAGLKTLKTQLKAKNRVLPASLAWIYPLILFAQQSPAHLDLARKFCSGESGKRTPDNTTGWGLWVYAIDIRRGETDIDPGWYRAAEYYAKSASLNNLWRVLLAAWSGLDTSRGAPKNFHAILTASAQSQITHLQQCGFNWLESQINSAMNIINDQPAPPGFFIAGKAEHWRELLTALQSLGNESPAGADSSASVRYIWMLSVSKDGALKNIQPLEQKQGLRGWNKAKDISLAKISGNPQLSPHDAKVVNSIKVNPYNRRDSVIELSNAIQALVGHPYVVLDNHPDQFIALSEGIPEIEVIHKGDKITLNVTPKLREGASPNKHYYDADEKREAEALRLITLVQDSPQRMRLIRFTPSQRRAAQLLAEKVTIPASAEKELQTAMQALTNHFQLQADKLQAAREIPAESLLRAELSPLNEGLLLRLVATPLGEAGPRLVPGSGRARLMALVNGDSIGTTRQLDVERNHLETVLDALPFLEGCEGDTEHCEWDVPEPEDALALVEVLPGLPAIASLDWPKGKAVRVITVDLPQLSVKIKSERDWFKVEGEAQVDESMVFTFESLLEASKSSSRFIAMGNGVYAALTRRLKDRLSDLASVTETGKQGNRIPRMAAAWMDDALQDIATKSDKEFNDALEKLRSSQELAIPLPKTLQAELRPYQEDGYLWASRLAQAGFGACLADDMGLGKTLQSLAMLLARAENGPALIIAPTSVCGNWVAEAARFAPSLNLHLYSEADRETLINEAGPFDVVVVSYNLVQLAGEQFAAKHWHTLIADEAQAIKNATTKRSQAVFELNADFRLALSGTPVENRLSELWSIMRFANPGLLGTLPRFNERFATPIERDKDRNAQHTLRRLIAPFLLRRTKSQVLQELPPRTELIIKIAPGKEEASHYEAIRRQAIAEADMALASGKAGQARMNILAQLTRLRRAACDPRIVTSAYPVVGSKVQTFTELAVELVANGHKALVFSQFVDFLSLLREALDNVGIDYQYLDGATPAGERTKRVAAFQAGKSDLFLISLKAGGFGLNLTAADYVVITDPWWNPAAEDQAMGRAHRMGQLRPVTVYRLVTQGTVEEQIVGLHNDKRALAESILGEGEAVSLPSTAELISLIKGD